MLGALKPAASTGIPSLLFTDTWLLRSSSLPWLFFLERNTQPSMTWKIFLQAFFCGLLRGTLPRNLFLDAIQLTSATFATAITNVLSAMTFILAILMRLEKLKIQTIASQAKVIGTVVGISGAMLITFYDGPQIDLWPNNFHLLKGHNVGLHHKVVNHKAGSHILGSMLAIACTLCTAIWLIIQALMSEEYPCPYSMTVLMCFMASVQSMVYALCLERDWSQWKIKFDISILGDVLIVAGFYIVLFGKGRERTAVRQLSAQSKTGSTVAPRTAEIWEDPTSQSVSRSAV